MEEEEEEEEEEYNFLRSKNHRALHSLFL